MVCGRQIIMPCSLCKKIGHNRMTCRSVATTRSLSTNYTQKSNPSQVMELKHIVQKTFDPQVWTSLSDENLRGLFMEQKSSKKRMDLARKQIRSVLLDEDMIGSLMSVLEDHFLSPGMKGVVRGNEFNRIVKHILSDNFDHFHYELFFETECRAFHTPEKPDWWIHCKTTDRYVIGFNQVDLWTGGAQTNRRNKYLSESFHKEASTNVSMLCVVCAPMTATLLQTNSKHFEMIYGSFQQNRLCYTGALLETIQKLL